MRKSYLYILFDLDGTLTDSGPGIMNGIAYAIKKTSNQRLTQKQLRKFVGPPLEDSFRQIMGYSPGDTDKAIRFYREYYNEMGGIFENLVYPGIDTLLSDLKANGQKLIVATSKSANAANRVLEHYQLKQYFDFIAAPDGNDRSGKSDIIRYVIEQCKISNLSQAVMIGDRENDMIGASDVGIDSIGVLYGYGSREELTAAGATYLVESVPDLRLLLAIRRERLAMRS